MKKYVYELCKEKLNKNNIKCEIIENSDVMKKVQTIISVENEHNEDMFIRIIDKKNSPTIYLLYYFYQYDWPNVWLMSSTDVTDVIDKIKKENMKVKESK